MYGQMGTLEDLEKTLKHLDILRVNIMKAINDVKYNLDMSAYRKVKPTQAHPLSKVTHEVIDNIPYFQFSYDGMLPHFNERDNEHLSLMRKYYLKATLSAYDYSKIDYKFKNAFIVFVQYFKDNIIRDLENRNKKYIQDAIKATGLIPDDCWHSVWNADLGFLDPESNHVQVYVVSQNDFGKFYSIILDRHDELKKTTFLNTIKNRLITEIESEKERKNEEKNRLLEAQKMSGFF